MRDATGEPLVVGVDIGTQGARVVCADVTGRLHARAAAPIPGVEGIAAEEQAPRAWWAALVTALRQMSRDLGSRARRIAAISTSGTSGTLCCLDDAGRPVRPALMYSDRRSAEDAAWLNDQLRSPDGGAGRSFDASFGLPKAIWLRRVDPATFRQVRRLCSPGDFIVGNLTGQFDGTDYTQALKLGFDTATLRWPAWLEDVLDFDASLFPTVVPSGSIAGTVRPEVAEETGLPPSAQVVVGTTDGIAGQMACAPEPGRWATVLGTTLVWKGMTSAPMQDPLGRIYNHRGTSGAWLPGAAGNCGGRILHDRFGADDWSAWDRRLPRLPTGVLMFPLVGTGERFPIKDPNARGFTIGPADESAERAYAACLEGVACVERWGYDVAMELGAAVEGTIATTGGASKSDAWLLIRACVLNRSIAVPTESEPAFGAAIVAAAGLQGEDARVAAQRMVTWRTHIDPEPFLASRYDETYQRFRSACRERGYS